MSGSSLALGAAAQIENRAGRESSIRRCHLIGFIRAMVSCGLLIHNLTACTASLAASYLPKQTRTARVTTGTFGTLDSLLMRFIEQHEGVLSVRDTRASFYQQRAGEEAVKVIGSFT